MLVTYKGDRAALAAIRGLAQGGYQVFAIPGDQQAVSLGSRYARALRVGVSADEEPSRFVEAVAELVRMEGIDVVLAGCDESLAALSSHREQIEPFAVLGLPSDEAVLASQDKSVLNEMAAQVGFVTPRTTTCWGVEEALAAAEKLGYPAVVKPYASVAAHAGGARTAPSRTVADPQEVRRALLDFGSPLLIQQYLPGSVYSLGGVRSPVGVIAAVLARYQRTWPRHAGNAAFSVTAPIPTGLLELVERLLARIGWHGIFELEFVQDRQGAFVPIDLNPRIYGSMSLATSAGVNLSRLWVDLLLGREVPRPTEPAIGSAGYHYRWEDGDARHMISLIRAGQVAKGLSILKPVSRTTHAHFSWRDPVPLLARLTRATQSRLASGPSR